MNQDQIVKVYKQWHADLLKFQEAHGIICPIRAAVFIKRITSFSNALHRGWNELKFYKYIEQQRQELVDLINDDAFDLEVKWTLLKPITVPVGYFAACRPNPDGPVKFGYSLCSLADLHQSWPVLGKLIAIQYPLMGTECPSNLVSHAGVISIEGVDKHRFFSKSILDKELDFDLIEQDDGRFDGVARIFPIRVWEQLERFKARCDSHFKLSKV